MEGFIYAKIQPRTHPVLSATVPQRLSNQAYRDERSLWYLIEIGPNSVIEKILEEGQITSRDDVLAYEISADAYAALGGLFVKP